MEDKKNEELIGPELVISILRDAGEPITTRQLQNEVKKVVPRCLASSVIALNLMRIRGTIKGKRAEDRKWVWWVED
jgi:hypothetical protein